jgi:hypothetical protein
LEQRRYDLSAAMRDEQKVRPAPDPGSREHSQASPVMPA